MTIFGIAIIAVTVIFPAFQLFNLPNVSDKIALFSQYLGLAALILMAWGQILATRFRGVEVLFGGLDRVYVLHKWAGIAAMLAILFHDTIDAEMRGLGRETLLVELAETLGEISLYGLLILVVVSIATFIPYQLWKWTHKAMGALFAAGVLHFFFILKPFSMSDPSGIFTGIFCIAGLVAYGWTLLPEKMRPSHTYKITKIEQTGGAIAVSLAPRKKGLRAQPGQFGVFRFTGADKGEPHPFSFSHLASDGQVRVTVQALGDFTGSLGKSLEIGQDVHVQGPFGRFTFSNKSPQIWVAGGIGITPFLTWVDALTPEDGPVHFFYCVRSRDEAPHLEEIQQKAKTLPNLSLHLMVSSEGTRLSTNGIVEAVGAQISGAKVSFCGPVSLREMLQKGLRRHGVGPRHFHFEEFEFRTGVGLKKLASWLLEKRQERDSTKASVQG